MDSKDDVVREWISNKLSKLISQLGHPLPYNGKTPSGHKFDMRVSGGDCLYTRQHIATTDKLRDALAQQRGRTG